tara:strand:+ start:734 stop:1018 length:285 start_codon:yes stop_codon:yes gene_type:complete
MAELTGKVDSYEFREGMYVSFSWRGEYSEEPMSRDCPPSWSWWCGEITEAKVFSDYKCEGGRTATDDEKEEMRRWVEDWEPQELFDGADNIDSE